MGCWGGWQPFALLGEWLAPAALLKTVVQRVLCRLQMSIDRTACNCRSALGLSCSGWQSAISGQPPPA